MQYTINTRDKEYIELVRSRMKLYFATTIVFAITTIVFLFAWLDLIRFIKSL